jgi:hypothetical protein
MNESRSIVLTADGLRPVAARRRAGSERVL